MEYLDIRDKNGNPTGVIKERSLVHADGDLHGTSHVWIVKKNEKGSYDLLLQKRNRPDWTALLTGAWVHSFFINGGVDITGFLWYDIQGDVTNL